MDFPYFHPEQQYKGIDVTRIIDTAFLKNPYPVYSVLRAQSPVHWSEDFCGGAWLFTDYADVMHALRDPAFSTRRAGGWANTAGADASARLTDFKRIFSRALLFVDGRQHSRLRRAMNAGFRPALLESFRPRIARIVDELTDKLAQETEADFIASFARELPARVIAGLLGVDESDRNTFFSWSDDIAAFVSSPTPTIDSALRAQESLLALCEYFQALLPQRRQHHRPDLIGMLLEAEEQGLIVTTKELLAQCCTLLFAGHETTRNLLGSGLYTLLQHPQQLQQLRANPTLMGSALREMLRFETPVQYTGRRMKVNMQLHGHNLKKGDLVIPLIGAANRDPKRFRDPDSFDLHRDEGNHLAFGYGPHVCIGAALTYLEAEVAFSTLLHRFPELQLATDAAEWMENAVYRGFSTLPVRPGRSTSCDLRKIA